jgi:hypothetical protein
MPAMDTDRQHTSAQPAPIGYRGYVAMAAADARPEPLHIQTATFSVEAEARRWVEQARAVVKDSANFAASVVPIYGTSFDAHDDAV